MVEGDHPARAEEEERSGIVNTADPLQLRAVAFMAAVRMKVVREDPTAAIDPPKVPKSETKLTIPTAEQVGAAIAQAPDGIRGFVAVCAFAGFASVRHS